MANRARGEAELSAGERVFRLRLTLGALAEIEDGLSLSDFSEVEARLKKLRANDLAIVAAALIRGGGTDITPLEALRLPVGLPELVRAVTDAFGGGDEKGVAADATPFPGPDGSKSD
jgi:Phage tail tube protein, GTA-gp10